MDKALLKLSARFYGICWVFVEQMPFCHNNNNRIMRNYCYNKFINSYYYYYDYD